MFTKQRSLVEIQRNYLKTICKNVDGLKCMIFDKETAQLISLNFLQSEGFELEVFLFEDIDNIKQEKLNYVSAIYILTNPAKFLKFFQEELKNPNFKEYHIFFLQDVQEEIIRKFAEFDEQDLIKSLERLFCYYHAVNNELFHSNIENIHKLVSVPQHEWEQEENKSMQNMEETIVSTLCSLRSVPYIRYLNNSQICEQLAERVQNNFSKLKKTFGNQFENERPLLLILERKEDPYTPLIYSWSYQAMLHEFIGIKDNKIISKGKEYNLNQQYDTFYQQNLFSNYGQVANNLKEKIDFLQQQKESYKKMEKFEDMQKVLGSIQNFQKDQALTQQHLSLTDDISTIIKQKDLFSLSTLQQKIVTKKDKKESFRDIMKLMDDKKIQEKDLFLLIILYCLKFEDQEYYQNLKQQFLNHYPQYKVLFQKIINRCGEKVRVSQIFQNDLSTKALQLYNDFFGEQQNSLELHVPLIVHLADHLLRGKLPEIDFPFLEGNGFASSQIPSTVIFYIIGGVTFQEAKQIGDLNRKYQDKLILLGGSNICNSDQFFSTYIGESVK